LSLEYIHKKNKNITFTPEVKVNDSLASYWFYKITIMLRREIHWCWYERGVVKSDNKGKLPPFIDKLSQILDMNKFSEEKKRFFQEDPVATYLTELIDSYKIKKVDNVAKGSFSWLKRELDLDDVSCFILGLALMKTFDRSVETVFASCQNDPTKVYPNLALAQSLWSKSEEIFDLVNPNHPLDLYGILQFHRINDNFEIDWDTPLSVSIIVADQLLYPDKPLIHELTPIQGEETEETIENIESLYLISSKIKSEFKTKIMVGPILGNMESSYKDILYKISNLINKPIVEYTGNPVLLLNTNHLRSLISYCWLKNVCLYLNPISINIIERNMQKMVDTILSTKCVPISIFLGISDKNQLKEFPLDFILPIIEIPQLHYSDRLKYWKKFLTNEKDDSFSNELDEIIQDCAFKFRFGKDRIKSICIGLNNLSTPINKTIVVNACRAEVNLEKIEFAQKIIPRFINEDVIFPPKVNQKFQEIYTAMLSLNKVYYELGLATVWNNAGITVLFTGPPGTGKTMSAEILAYKLNLPLYRIDLSQVINKYIGETEKNLKKLFDIAELADLVLFFDEADALFGRRTEIKDSHDRYANITVSYLLERIERFKGLAILASNKKENIDDAFKRRIRFTIDFQIPGFNERKKLWEQILPKTIDQSNIDINFLANKFPLTGGNIRSIVFNACLQSIGNIKNNNEIKGHKLSMNDIIRAIKREFEKIGKPVPLEQFETYSNIVKDM
jgi:hypothetical protein